MTVRSWQEWAFSDEDVLHVQASYQDNLAEQYRVADEKYVRTSDYFLLATRLSELERRFSRPVRALEIGCGTGRYFSCFQNVQHLTGVDLSTAMLSNARHPVRKDQVCIASIVLIQGNVLDPSFQVEGTFDLIYSIGVLAEHAPLTQGLAHRVANWLNPNGVFAVTAVPRWYRPGYWKVELAGRFLSLWPDPIPKPAIVTRKIIPRLGLSGYTISERALRKVLNGSGLTLEKLELILPDSYPHLWAVACRTA